MQDCFNSSALAMESECITHRDMRNYLMDLSDEPIVCLTKRSTFTTSALLMETFDIQNLIYFGKHKIVIVYHFSTMGWRTYRQASCLTKRSTFTTSALLMETFDIQNLIYFGKHKIVIVYHFSTMGWRTYRQASYISRIKSPTFEYF